MSTPVRAPGSLKPGPKQAEDPAPNGDKPKQEHPWSFPAEVVDHQGLSMFLFSFAGMGKTTLGLSMLHSLDGGPMLIVNFDEELRSISDLGPSSNVAVWPGTRQNGRIANWQQVRTFTGKLLSSPHPFTSIMFDTLNSAYDKFALPYAKQENPGAKDNRQLYGAANDEVLRLVGDFCAAAREKGWNVLFTGHAEEKQVGENGPMIIRPKISPGVILGLNQRVSIIGYLHPPLAGVRKLQLEPSPRITSKIHQPRSGPQVPGTIKNADLGLLINHMKHHKPYPKKED